MCCSNTVLGSSHKKTLWPLIRKRPHSFKIKHINSKLYAEHKFSISQINHDTYYVLTSRVSPYSPGLFPDVL